MNRVFSLLSCLILSSFCINIFAEEFAFPAASIDELKERSFQNPDTTYVINFWASWCAPCLKEIPLFDAIEERYLLDGVKVILVNLDSKRNRDQLVPLQVEKRNIRSEVIYLDETDANEWIPKVNESWWGALPATWVLQKQKDVEAFYGGIFQKGELEAWLVSIGVMERQ